MSAVLERLREGRPVWPWAWASLRRRDDPELLDAILDGLTRGEPATQGQRDSLLGLLAHVAARLSARHTLCRPPRPERIVAELAREDTPGRFDHFEAILRELGDAATEPLRALLDGPAREVDSDFVADADGSGTWRFRGAKLVALRAVAPSFGPGDAAALRVLSERDDEPAAVRRVARLLSDLVGGRLSPRQALAQAVLGIPTDAGTPSSPTSYFHDLARVALAGPILVPPAIELLDGGSATRRRRVADLLVQLGPAAKPQLEAELARTTDRSRQRLLRGLLARLAGQPEEPRRAAGDPALSRAEPPTLGDRDLSRAEPD